MNHCPAKGGRCREMVLDVSDVWIISNDLRVRVRVRTCIARGFTLNYMLNDAPSRAFARNTFLDSHRVEII